MASSSYRRPGAIVGFAMVAVVLLLEGLFVHELGHGITAKALGGEFRGLYVFPGVQVWPNAGQSYEGDWGLNVGLAVTAPGAGWGRWERGLVSLMGSGATMGLAVVALVSLWLLQPQGWLSHVLVAESLLYVDILFYTVLPAWFGMRHWFFFGGQTPEPLDGAELMGCPRWMFIALVLGASALMTLGVVGYIVRSRREPEVSAT